MGGSMRSSIHHTEAYGNQLIDETQLVQQLEKDLVSKYISEGWQTALEVAKVNNSSGDMQLQTFQETMAELSKAKTRKQQAQLHRARSPLLPGVYSGSVYGEIKASRVPKALRGGSSSRPEAEPELQVQEQAPVEVVPKSDNKEFSITRVNTRTFKQKPKKTPGEEEDDEDLKEAKAEYNAWKKKIIESARNLAFEVNRFDVGPRRSH